MTGSIGRQALDVVRNNRDRLRLWGACAARPVSEWRELVADLEPVLLASAQEDGADAIEELASDGESEIVLNAVVGSAGLGATLAALKAGKVLALANKESVAAAGDLVNEYRRRYSGSILPVDSEHSAIFQCLIGESSSEVSRLMLTASGGPFRGWSQDRLREITPAQAIDHPRWKMGPKISVDSATLVNKGLEVIEAHHLFGVAYEDIDILIHPQSIVHSLVEFTDGSVKAHLGPTDMRLPIQYALSYPERWQAACPKMDVTAIGRLDFESLVPGAYPCLDVTLKAAEKGLSYPAALSAANEAAVALFLGGRIGFTSIAAILERVLEEHEGFAITCREDFERVDNWARMRASQLGESTHVKGT